MITKIKDKLYNNEDEILNILQDLNCTFIHKTRQNELRFGRDEESSGDGNKINIETLSYTSFSHNTKGDIITLVSDILDIKLGEAIKWLANKLNISLQYTETDITLPFGGFFKKYKKVQDISEDIPKTYSESELIPYSIGISKMFIEDSIDAITQEHFGIGYSILDNRITIPWRNELGELVGIMGRLNKTDLNSKEKDYKYLPIIPFRKSAVLYGLYENYKSILNKGVIIIVESEKSVLKARQMGFDNVVALGGNVIQPRHIKLIKSMFIDVIVALDEGLPISHSIEEAEKCRISNPFFDNDIYVVQMNDNEYINQEKVCIFDLDKKTIIKILKEYTIYLG